jgi:thiol-disulfide isomerase/thioredoxin
LLFNSTFSRHKTNEELTVYFFIATSCPISQQYTKEIIRLKEQFKDQQVKFVNIFPNDGKKSIKKDIKEFNSTYELTTPFIDDKRFNLTKKLKATVTPEAFLISSNGKILYHGAIDNWYYQLGKNRINITAHYLEDAITEALQGKSITTPYAEPIGCFIEVSQIKR